MTIVTECCVMQLCPDITSPFVCRRSHFAGPVLFHSLDLRTDSDFDIDTHTDTHTATYTDIDTDINCTTDFLQVGLCL